MSGAEPIPPWGVNPGAPYQSFWIESGTPHVHSTWMPFWNALGEAERDAYLTRFPPPAGWDRFLEDVAMHEEWDRIDAEDIASGILQSNGSPWPKPAVTRPPLRSRIWVALRWLLGASTAVVRPVTRMTSNQVAAIAAASMTAANRRFGTMPPRLRKVEERLLWTVDSCTIGGGWRVEIDDATGTAGPVTWWGKR
ncbi:MAG: hypothetical protein ACRYF2_26640 [Janthinobacterium lividum]